MICIIRIQAQEKPELLWNDVLSKKDKLQEVLNGKGKILYLSKRRNYNEVSLFVHVADANILGCFIANHLAKLEGVTGIWLINMLKPVFHPLPNDAGKMKRYTVTIKAYSPKLGEIYSALANLAPSDDVSVGYLAYTCHLFGDCIQISLQAPDSVRIQKCIDEVISKIPGVLRTTLCEIERTHPFVAYEEWQKYISRNAVLVDWDDRHMVAQFSTYGKQDYK
ncbi:MAG: hypothetical protein HZA49_06155 [Planctomycetes bacterium]|nr:hypothetical protein [Planctomycetota bacterium]